ncbi:hypothetical protein GCM10010464_41220 [Pseudonocardia yunnanensis]|uniref:Glycosyltransferase n=1 Tax=Pseudonocardia yunnanensis TaxID=58107 RepID=A0ABW4F507_9PSEU
MASISVYGPMGAGHVNPTLGIVAELVRRGHEVTYWAPAQFADRIAETGARFVTITSTWESMGRDALPQMHGKELVRAIGLLLDETKALVPALKDSAAAQACVGSATLRVSRGLPNVPDGTERGR